MNQITYVLSSSHFSLPSQSCPLIFCKTSAELLCIRTLFCSSCCTKSYSTTFFPYPCQILTNHDIGHSTVYSRLFEGRLDWKCTCSNRVHCLFPHQQETKRVRSINDVPSAESPKTLYCSNTYYLSAFLYLSLFIQFIELYLLFLTKHQSSFLSSLFSLSFPFFPSLIFCFCEESILQEEKFQQRLFLQM